MMVTRQRSALLLWPFEGWIAVVAIYAGLAYFLPFIPSSGSARVVDVTFPRLVPIWSALYALGGIVVLVGLIRRSPRFEAAGLHFLGSGATLAALATLVAGAPVLPTLIVQGGVVVACIARLLVLRSLSK